MDTRRHAEEQETERCRIVEEERTRRIERLAETAQLLTAERQRTQRERDALRAQALQTAITVRGQVEAQRLQTRAGMLNLFQWMTASLVGALGASAGTPQGRRTVRRGAGISKYVSALLLVTFVRHLWLNSGSRKLLLRSAELGPYFRGALGKMLQAALSTILQEEHATKPEALSSHRGTELVPVVDNKVDALQRLAARKPLPGPEATPECWVSLKGPDGRTFWHHTALGPAPWGCDGAANAAHMLCEHEDGMEGVDSNPRVSQQRSSCSRSRSSSRTPSKARHMKALLANWGLGEYATALEENGYDSEVMRTMRPDEVKVMLEAIGCKKLHKELFQRAIESWR